MTENHEPGQIFDLIPKIMGEIGHVGKDNVASTPSFSYNFRGIDDVYNCVGPVLVKYGVFIVPSIKSLACTQITTAGGKPATQIVMEIAYRFYAPDGSFVEAITVGEAIDTGDKAANKAMSDAMKYAVWQTFCIPTIGIDSEQDSHEQAVPPEQPPADDISNAVRTLIATHGKNSCGSAAMELWGSNRQPTTLDELTQLAEKLQERKGTPNEIPST